MFVWHFSQAERTIDKIVVIADVACLASDLVTLCHTIEFTILDVNVIDVADGVECYYKNTISGFLAGNIFNIYIADCGIETTAAYFIMLVIEVDLYNTFTALAYLDIAHIDVLNNSASARVCLYAKYAVQIR